MMSEVLLRYKEQDLVIDRIHRIPKLRHLPSHVARATIARIHFYHVKEDFLKCYGRNLNSQTNTKRSQSSRTSQQQQ